MTCTACHAESNTGHATTTGEWVCLECLTRALMSPAERRKLDAAGKKAIRDQAKANLGMPTEARVLASIASLQARGWHGRLDKIPTPWKVIGRQGKGMAKCMPGEVALVDFLGYDSEGRVLAVEVKSVTRAPARFYIRDVRPHQAAYLDGVLEAGGLAFLLVDFPEAGRWCFVPWRVARRWVRVSLEDVVSCVYEATREDFTVWVVGSPK